MPKVYHGETQCIDTIKSGARKGEQCTNNAYYVQNGRYLCGVHSKKELRSLLPKNPDAAAIKAKLLKERELLVVELAESTTSRGKVVCSKLRMMKEPDHIDGYLKVFPNYKHANRVDGFGCATLSPKSMGPIHHKMKGIPTAKTLENYHQFSKIFPWEVKGDTIKTSALELRKEGYRDPVPHRHKFDFKVMKEKLGGNVNVPKFSVYYSMSGEERRYSYIECRYFYCYWYTKIAKELPEYKKLRKLLRKGYHLQIIGYDGYPVTESLYDHYLDGSRPFGHEMVLYTLLTVKNETNYPWEVYRREHPEIYEDMFP